MQEPMDEDILSRWITMLLRTRSGIVSWVHLRQLVDRCIEREAVNPLLDIFEVVATVRLKVGEFPTGLYRERADGTKMHAELEPTSEDYRYVSHYIWTNGLRPNIAKVAESLFVRVVATLEQQHRTLFAWGGASREWDAIGRRRAISTRSHNESPEVLDVLIDSASDSLKWYATNNQLMATHWCDVLVGTEAPILRRLAIYGMTELDLAPDKKVDWMLERSNVCDHPAREEVHRFLQVVYPLADARRRQAVVDAILSYRWTSDDEDAEAFAVSIHFSRIEWLIEAAPDFPEARKALQHLEKEHPDHQSRIDYQPRARTRTSVGPRWPWEPEELLGQPASEWYERLWAFRPTVPLGPDRAGLLEAVKQAADRDFDWGVALAEELLRNRNLGSDLWEPVLSRWARTNLDGAQYETLLHVLRVTELYEFQARPIADILCALIRNDEVCADCDLIKCANRIAVGLSEFCSGDDVPGQCSDWLQVAIAHPAGVLAEFWAYELTWWKETPVGSICIEECRDVLSAIVRDPRASGKLGRSVIARHLSDLMDADETWATESLIPLFLDHSNKAEYQAVWDGVLNEGVSSSMAEVMKKPFVHAAGRIDRELSCRSRRRRFIECYTVMITFVAEDPVGKWIPALFAHAAEEDRDTFAVEMRERLKDLEGSRRRELWKLWLKRYWINRLQGVPHRLDGREIWQMLRWLPWLGDVFEDAVNVAIQMPKRVFDDAGEEQFVVFELDHSDLPENFPEAVATLLVYVDSCQGKGSWYRGKELVDRLLNTGISDGLKRELTELIARQGL